MRDNAVWIRVWNRNSALDRWFARLLDNSITTEGDSVADAVEAMEKELDRRPNYYGGRPVLISSIQTVE